MTRRRIDYRWLWTLVLHTLTVIDASGRCENEDALGMESGSLLDAQISASSAFDQQSVGPQNARIRTDSASGAWCAKNQVKNGSYEFLQINLLEMHILTEIETQGRYGNGTGREFVSAYRIDYWRPGTSRWMRWTSRSGNELLEGNVDTTNAVTRRLDPPIVASKVRIVPHSQQPRTACLRLEIYGCRYKNGLLAYSLSQPSNIAYPDFLETSKDLDASLNTSRSLGLLVDGHIATDPPLDPIAASSHVNNSWLGWRRNETGGELEIRLDFEHTHHFTSITFFGWGQPPVQIETAFSTDGQTFEHTEQSRHATSDERRADFYKLNVQFDADARLVKVRLWSDAEWLYLSELQIQTDNANGTSLLRNFSFTDASYTYLYYILLAVLTVFFIILTTGLCVAIRRRAVVTEKAASEKLRQMAIGSPYNTDRAMSAPTAFHSNTLITTLPLKTGDRPRHVIHSRSFAPPVERAFSPFIAVYDQPEQHHHLRHPMHRALGVAPTSQSCSSTMFPLHSTRHNPPSLLEILRDVKAPPLQSPPLAASSTASTVRADQSSNSSDGIYAEPSSTAPLLPHAHCRPLISQSPARQHRTLPVTRRSKSVKCSSSKWYDQAVTNLESPTKSRPPLLHNVELVGRQLGEGKFTSIYECRIGDRRAAMKTIRVDSDVARIAMSSEAQLSTLLHHENMNSVIGVCKDLSIVSELAENGDVRSYLLHADGDVEYKTLLRWCMEMAAALLAIERAGLVHGHFSPSSCLVDSHLTIKVTGARVGESRSTHAKIRYSDPTAVLLNTWSTMTDVYSFGVSAFEILHACAMEAFAPMVNQELLENARLIMENASTAVYPDSLGSSIRDSEISQLLRDCWAPMQLRPNFHEIWAFLQRKRLQLQ